MFYGVDVPIHEAYGDVRVLVRLAQAAEAAGWDGFFIWDEIARADGHPLADPWITLAAIAATTARIKLGVMITPLSRRRPWKLARELASLDVLSGGRVIQGFGLGGNDTDFAAFDEVQDARTRGQMLSEGLAVVDGLLSGEPFRFAGERYTVQQTQFRPKPVQPRLPLWLAGMWPNKAPARRAARYDGYFPIMREGFAYDAQLSVERTAEAVQFVQAERAALGRAAQPFDFAHWGITAQTDDPAGLVGAYEAVGVTWWMENVSPWVYGWESGSGAAWPLDAMEARVLAGPLG